MKARLICQEQGGVLAYKGFGDSASYQSIYDNLIAPTDHSNYYFGGYYESEILYGLDGEPIPWQNYKSNEPSRGATELCIRVCHQPVPGKWCDSPCELIVPVAICQRPKSKRSRILNSLDGQVDRAYASGVVDSGSTPSQTNDFKVGNHYFPA